MRGFTLLEMVAVLFVVGLVSSLVIPRFPAMQASMDFALKRNSFEQAMNNLAYRAFKEHEDFILAGTFDADGRLDKDDPASDSGDEGLPGSMTIISQINTTRVTKPPVVLATVVPPLPEGWRISFQAPIHYSASGYCTGGTARVDIGSRSYNYRFKAPLCEIALEP